MTTRRGDQPPDLSDEAVPTSEVNPPGLPITNSWPAVGLIWGNAGALASAAVPEHPGTGSAVLGMLQLDTLRTAWHYDRGDALAWLVTCVGVLALGVEAGVIVGVVLSMGTLIWRASRPHIAVLGRIPGTEHFRNVDRYAATTCATVLILRVDANLFFGNVDAVNERIEDELRAHPSTRHLVLAMSAVSSIDTTALFALQELNASLRARGIHLHLAEVKGPVMDRLRASSLPDTLNGRIFLSTAIASDFLNNENHPDKEPR